MAVLEQIILEIGPHPENELLSQAREDIQAGNYNEVIHGLIPLITDPDFTFAGVPFTRAQSDDAQVLTFISQYKQLSTGTPATPEVLVAVPAQAEIPFQAAVAAVPEVQAQAAVPAQAEIPFQAAVPEDVIAGTPAVPEVPFQAAVAAQPEVLYQAAVAAVPEVQAQAAVPYQPAIPAFNEVLQSRDGAIEKILEAKAFVDVNMPQRIGTLNTLFDLEHAGIWISEDVRDRARDVLLSVSDLAAGGEKVYLIAGLDFKDGQYAQALSGFERSHGMNSKRPGLLYPIDGQTFDDTDIGRTLNVLKDPMVTNQMTDFDHLKDKHPSYEQAEVKYRHGAVTDAMKIFRQVKAKLHSGNRRLLNRDRDAKQAMVAAIMHYEAKTQLIGGLPQNALQTLQRANEMVKSPDAYEKMAGIYQTMK